MINIIQSFVRAVCFFSRGNIQEHINLETHDELSQLADSFNNMVNELQSIEYENSLRAAMDKARSIIFMKDVLTGFMGNYPLLIMQPFRGRPTTIYFHSR
jgi:nitrogen fixation/metabolism regulation signal transduction histidine kinase